MFVKYWVSDDCDDIAIGFNMVTGALKFNNPASYSSIAPTASSKWNSFKSTINNIENDFVYQRVFNSEVVKDWINPTMDKLYMILPNIKIKNIIGKGNILDWPTHAVLQQMYDAPYKYACSRLEAINGAVYNKIDGKIKPTDPRIAYVVWGQSDEKFEKAKPFISGVKQYGPSSSKTVRFNQSFGFNYDGVVSPFLPSEFTIDYFDGFGAVKYRGQWLGIRFIGDDTI